MVNRSNLNKKDQNRSKSFCRLGEVSDLCRKNGRKEMENYFWLYMEKTQCFS